MMQNGVERAAHRETIGYHDAFMAAASQCFALTLRRGLLLAVILGGCRERPLQAPTIDWQSATVEKAALLLVDNQGAASLVCLPGQRAPRPMLAGTALRRILDVAWKDGLLLVGSMLSPEIPGSDEIVLLAPHAEARRFGQGVLGARFSPDGGALAYQVQKSTPLSATSFVLDLTTGKLTELPGLADPRWEADGQHLRATLLRVEAPDSAPRSLRARWDLPSASTGLLGPGSAQIPAPKGTAVAWSADPRGPNAHDSCIVRLGRPGGAQLPHKVQGEFCAGVADDRGVRWSPDGQWLAFPHPGPVPGGRDPSKSFLDVVAIAGGRSPALMTLHTRVGPAASEIATTPASVWIDWSPVQRFLAIQDGAGDLRLYDFEAQGIAALGQGGRPQWSPGGSYLMITAGNNADALPHVLVLSGVSSKRIDFGPASDARWIPAQACDGA
jgi:hypothetical protein